MIMGLTGLDVFTKGKAADGLARAKRANNPFDMGVVSNCWDFWTAGKTLGVEYERLYDVPPEGFHEAKRRREKEDEEEGRGKKAKTGLGRFHLSFGRNRSGYEPVSQV